MSKDNDYFSYEARQARRARRLASFDGIAGVGESRSIKLTTQNAGQAAVRMARDVLDNFLLPSMPKLSYSGIRGAKVAQSSSKLEDGVITIFAEMKTRSGVVVGFDMPMEIRAGELMEPSVILVTGSPRILAQSSFDDIVDHGTIYENPPVRDLFSAPLSAASAKEQYGNRTKQKIVNTGLFSLGANKQALKDVIAGRAIESQNMAPAPKEYVPGRHPITQPMPKLKGPVQYGQSYNDDTTQNELPGTTPSELPNLPTKNLRSPTLDGSQTFNPSNVHDEVPMDVPWERSSRNADVESYDADDRHEKPDHDRNTQEDDYLDPAERTTNDICAGDKVSIKEEMELKDRGGAAYDISKGTKVLVVRDHAGDNKSFVIRLDDGMEAIVERRFLSKTGQYISAPEEGMPTIQKQKQEMDNKPVSLVADMEFMGKVNQELQHMADQGISEIDARAAILHKYGIEVAAKIFE